MSVSLKSLGIDRLGIEQRLALVEELWDSIAADSAAPSTDHDAQRAELDEGSPITKQIRMMSFLGRGKSIDYRTP